MRDLDRLKNPRKDQILCPMVNRINGRTICGVVPAGDLAVYEINMFMLEAGPLYPQLNNCAKYNYASYEEMIEDGWRVD